VDCGRCVKLVGCKLRGDNERVPYCEYYRRPRRVALDVPRYPAKPKRYLPAQFVLGREQDVVCAQRRGDPKTNENAASGD
jgi:hypothetical protein